MSVAAALAGRIARGTAAAFARREAVLAFMLLSLLCAAGSIAWPGWNVFGAFLGMLSLAVTCAILYDGNAREAIATRRDAALHAKIDGIVHGTAADDRLAGIERDDAEGVPTEAR